MGNLLFVILIEKPILLFSKRNINQYICIHEYIKAGKSLKKEFGMVCSIDNVYN